MAEMVEMRRRMIDVLVDATGQPRERITADIDRDYIVRDDAGRRLRPGRRDHQPPGAAERASAAPPQRSHAAAA